MLGQQVLFLQDPKVITVGGEKEKEEYGTFPKPVNKGEKAVLIAEETGGDKVSTASTLQSDQLTQSYEFRDGAYSTHPPSRYRLPNTVMITNTVTVTVMSTTT